MKKILAILLAAIMIFALAACGGETPQEPANDNTSNTENTSSAEEPKEEDYYVTGIINPLTGEETKEDLSANRPIALSMNNQVQAMPMHGITDADIIIEMNVENDVTRMLSLFQDITSESKKIGAIRSARPYYIDWALGFDAIYITASGSARTLAKIAERKTIYVNVDDFAATRKNPVPNIFYRDRDRLNAGYALEHTMFAKAEGFENHKSDLPVELGHRDGYSCALGFTTKVQTEGGKDAAAFTVKMNSKKITEFAYDSASKLYKVSQHGKEYIDGNNKQQVAIKNVLVLNTKYWPEYAGATTLLADMSGGTGTYYCEGKTIDIEWKLSEEGGLQLTKADGSELRLAVGKTFICCADAEKGGVEIK